VMLEPLLLIGGFVVAGGLLGSYMGAKLVTQRQLQIALGIVLVIASLKLFFQ